MACAYAKYTGKTWCMCCNFRTRCNTSFKWVI
ncbi:MAG TPA: hypothetical protein VFD60_14575 [Nitrososphaeraceae archaeon]|nr:hypothetical protein [Nitrososphaeraceae archaeon]